MRKILYIIMLVTLFTACTKEIDFDFHEIDPIVVIEGKVTNEGSTVVLSRSRSVNDSVRARCLQGAHVTVTDNNGITSVLTYDAATNCYRSAMTGIAGQTYLLSVDFEGQHFEGSATMPGAAPIVSSEFSWLTVMGQRMLSYELWAVDPEPDVRNYYWFRMDRLSHHPHFEGKSMTEPYRWTVLDDRGCPPGTLFLDMVATSEQIMDEDEEEFWNSIIYDGDSISVQLMTVDATVYEYMTSLRAGQSNGANPRSNLTGGCLGYFVAGSLTRTDTIVFNRSNIKEWEK